VAFDALVDELETALVRNGLRLERGPAGHVYEGELEVGRVVAWEPGRLIGFEWFPADWEPSEITHVEIRFEAALEGTRVTVEQPGWGGLLADRGEELAGWFAGEVAAPFLRATSPGGFGDWLTDRRARQPSGALARDTYRDPLYHRPNFGAILAKLDPGPGDFLLEVGSGGGAFLQEALETGCRAAAVDHSEEMVATARELNAGAIATSRLQVVQADAEKLPFDDESFNLAAMTGVIGFLRDPVAALAEIHRTLVPGGRLAVFTGSAALRGTPAAPEPMASRGRFYADDELEEIARAAGFAEASVEEPDLEEHARAAGVPTEQIAFFRGPGGAQLLLARKA
jgi:SAM-dependent methyltransferase